MGVNKLAALKTFAVVSLLMNFTIGVQLSIVSKYAKDTQEQLNRSIEGLEDCVEIAQGIKIQRDSLQLIMLLDNIESKAND